MTLLWPWGLLSLLPVAAAAVWALRRPLHQLVPVGSLRLWQQVVDDLGAAATRARRVSAAWVVLLAGAVLAAAALSRPTYYADAPARRIAVAVCPSAELTGLPGGLGGASAAFFEKLDAPDRVRLILPAVLGGAGELLSRDAAARAVAALRPLPAPADQLKLPGEPDAQHLYRFAPATLLRDDGPHVTTIALPARPGEVTFDAFAVAPLPDGSGQVEVFLALQNHASGQRRGEVLCRRDADPPAKLSFDLPPGERKTLLARLPGAGQSYSARIAGTAGPGVAAFCVRRSSAVRQVALIGRDDPLVRRFLRVDPALRPVGDAAAADVVIAVGANPPPGKAALVINPPDPPPGWRGGTPLAGVALRDADVLADHPVLAHVDLSTVAVRRAVGWRSVGLPAHQRLLRVGPDALLLAGEIPPRIYLAFDLAAENTGFAMTEAFVILMANAMEYLAPGARPQETYEHVTPLEAMRPRDWTSLAAPGEPPAAADGPLLWPGVYRDASGALHAVSLLGLKSAEPEVDVRDQIAAISLPPPMPAARGRELWPALALGALALWLIGWGLRLR